MAPTTSQWGCGISAVVAGAEEAIPVECASRKAGPRVVGATQPNFKPGELQ
jgi:hypothetical protein